jgi:hypothetical protein
MAYPIRKAPPPDAKSVQCPAQLHHIHVIPNMHPAGFAATLQTAAATQTPPSENQDGALPHEKENRTPPPATPAGKKIITPNLFFNAKTLHNTAERQRKPLQMMSPARLNTMR